MKILYATDFSKNAEIAFSYASKLIKKVGSNLIMLHVNEIPTAMNHPYLKDMHEMKNRVERESKIKLRELYSQAGIDTDVTFACSENSSVVQGILEVIDEERPELVIVGIRGESKLREFLIGSTTKALIRKSSCPVLAVPKNVGNIGWKNIMFASDLLETDALAIKSLLELVSPFNSEITLTHVDTHSEDEGEEQMKLFKEMISEQVSYGEINYQLLLSNDVFRSLNSYLERHEIDLLVMIEKEHHSIFDRLFQKDLLKKMEFHIDVPLLTYNEHFLKMQMEQIELSTN